jgi:membrane protease YdiL (CAAX protease family)
VRSHPDSSPLSWLAAIVFVMVLGEEIGWRGFALPKLQAALAPLAASIAIGVIWAVWHLPLFFMSGMPQYESPFFAYTLYTIALSIVLTFLATHTAGSVVIATLVSWRREHVHRRQCECQSDAEGVGECGGLRYRGRRHCGVGLDTTA